MVNRIIDTIKQKGMSINAVEKELGFGNGAIKRFNNSSPSIDKIVKLSNFLNVSLEWLVTGKYTSSPSFSSEEEFLIDTYRNLNEAGRQYLLSTAKMVKNEYKKDTTISSTETA